MSVDEVDNSCWEFIEGIIEPSAEVLLPVALTCGDDLPSSPASPARRDGNNNLLCYSPAFAAASPTTSSAVSSLAEFQHCTLDSVAADIMDDMESNPWASGPQPLSSPFYDEEDCEAAYGGLCPDSIRNLTCHSFSTARTMSSASSLPCTPSAFEGSTDDRRSNFLNATTQRDGELQGLPGTVAPGRGTVAKKRGRKPSEGRCCMVPSCRKPLFRNHMYYFRRRMCESCIRQSSVLIDGREMRFCQQCSLVHPVSDFDTNKRSCRAKLQAHKARAHSKKSDPSSPTKRKRPRASTTAGHSPGGVNRRCSPSSPAEGTSNLLGLPPLLDDSLPTGDCTVDVDFEAAFFDGASDHMDVLYTAVASDDTAPFVFTS